MDQKWNSALQGPADPQPPRVHRIVAFLRHFDKKSFQKVIPTSNCIPYHHHWHLSSCLAIGSVTFEVPLPIVI